MPEFKTTITDHPFMAVSLMIAVSFAFVLGVPLLTESGTPENLLLKTLTRTAFSVTAILMVFKLGWADVSGIKNLRIRASWLVAILPMMLIVGINLLGATWSELVFAADTTTTWLAYNFSVGLYEETLLRGLCFTVLAAAWREVPKGLMKAALAQAILFGLLHLINLVQAPVVDTIAQTIYATMLGFGFAGLIAYTGSIWPGIFVHAAINLAGSMNSMLVPGAEDTPGDIFTYMVAIVVITLVSALPGYFQIRKAMHRQHAET